MVVKLGKVGVGDGDSSPLSPYVGGGRIHK